MIAKTPETPYYAVIFTSVRTEVDDGYEEMSRRMEELASTYTGFIGFEAARKDIGLFISYWKDLESIKKWKANSEHLNAQKMGYDKWYSHFRVRIAKIEREYGFDK